MSIRYLLPLIVISSFAVGCSSDNNNSDTCDASLILIEYLNPSTGQCEAVPHSCDGDNNTWANCDSQCTDLNETTCLDTAGCLASYSGPVQDSSNFRECIAQGTTMDSADCSAKNAEACTSDTSCSPIYSSSGFSLCDTAKNGCLFQSDCETNENCNASILCLLQPGCDPLEGCISLCYGFCEAL